jgi:hypothetical protein
MTLSQQFSTKNVVEYFAKRPSIKEQDPLLREHAKTYKVGYQLIEFASRLPKEGHDFVRAQEVFRIIANITPENYGIALHNGDYVLPEGVLRSKIRLSASPTRTFHEYVQKEKQSTHIKRTDDSECWTVIGGKLNQVMLERTWAAVLASVAAADKLIWNQGGVIEVQTIQYHDAYANLESVLSTGHIDNISARNSFNVITEALA